jgi:hypothetical protein
MVILARFWQKSRFLGRESPPFFEVFRKTPPKFGGDFLGGGGVPLPQAPKTRPPKFRDFSQIFENFRQILGFFGKGGRGGRGGSRRPTGNAVFGISGDDLGVGVTTQSRGKSPLLRAKRGAPGCNDRGCGNYNLRCV